MVLDIKSVLVLDVVGTKCIEILRRHGIQVTKKVALTERELIEEIPNYDALVVQYISKVTIDVFLAGRNLKVVASAGEYYSNIDIFAASNKKIGIINAPGGNVISAGEFTCGLTIALARHVENESDTFHNSLYDPYRYIGSELKGKTLALIGLGDIARQVSIRMAALGMNVIGYDPILTTEQCHQICVHKMELPNIWPIADYIIFYTSPFDPYCTDISAEVLAQCKRGVQIIIVGYIDEFEAEDIYDGLNSGQVAAAAFDLYEDAVDENILMCPVFEHPSVITTLHVGTETEEAVERGGKEAAEQLVNLCKPGTYKTPLSIVVRGNGM